MNVVATGGTIIAKGKTEKGNGNKDEAMEIANGQSIFLTLRVHMIWVRESKAFLS